MRTTGIALLLLAALGCGQRPAADARPRVVVSIPPLAWFVERLAGDAVAVDVLLPPGANPHAFEPTLQTLQAAERAAVFVRVGHPRLAFELAALEALADRPGLAVVDAASESARSLPDPHVWLSPREARRMAQRIADALAEHLPAEADRVRRAEPPLDREIEALDRELGARLAPLRGRAFLVYHPDWTAFAADYGLRQLVLERGHKEPDAKALHDRIEEARREGVRAVFAAPQYPRENAELVAREIGARVVVIDPLARDWPATLRAMTDALVQAFAP